MRTAVLTAVAAAAGCGAGLALDWSGPFAFILVGLGLSACCPLVALLGRRGSEAPLGLAANAAMTGTLLACRHWYYAGIGRPDIYRDMAPGLLGWAAVSAVVTLLVAMGLRGVRGTPTDRTARR
jgi:hypothetical protein